MIDLVYRLVKYYIRKNRFGGSPSKLEFNNLAKVAQFNVINRSVELKGFETYSIINDEISNLKRKETINISSTVFNKPSDFMFLMGLESVDGDGNTKDIDMLRNNEFNYRKDSSIVAPDLDFPVAESFNTNWKVLPDTVNKINCTYIKKPSDPEWASTTVNGREVYDANNSTDFELPESMLTEITLEILQQMGISVRENQVIKYANEMNRDE